MEVPADFQLYIGAEMGNIGGFAAPADEGRLAMVYIGFDKELKAEAIDTLICHELNHFARLQKVSFGKDTVLSRMILEGLGTYAPICMKHLTWNAAAVCEVMCISMEAAEKLLRSSHLICDEMLKLKEQAVTSDIMHQYFNFTPNADMLHGYFAGLFIIHTLVAGGHDFNKLTVMEAKTILELFCN